jgi:hypothetical protein
MVDAPDPERSRNTCCVCYNVFRKGIPILACPGDMRHQACEPCVTLLKKHLKDRTGVEDPLKCPLCRKDGRTEGLGGFGQIRHREKEEELTTRCGPCQLLCGMSFPYCELQNHEDNVCAKRPVVTVGSYRGQVNDKNLPHGKGTDLNPTGYKGFEFSGDWVNGLQRGDGTLTRADGVVVYDGTFVDNRPHGKGTITYGSGDTYTGDVANCLRSGTGTIVFKKGGTYIGEFVNDDRHGVGEVVFPSGAKYIGEFANNEYHGRGTIEYVDGNRYTGNFANGKRHGDGNLFIGTDRVQIQRWDNGNQVDEIIDCGIRRRSKVATVGAGGAAASATTAKRKPANDRRAVPLDPPAEASSAKRLKTSD